METREELQEQLEYETPEVQDLGSIEEVTGAWIGFWDPDDMATWLDWGRT